MCYVGREKKAFYVAEDQGTTLSTGHVEQADSASTPAFTRPYPSIPVVIRDRRK